MNYYLVFLKGTYQGKRYALSRLPVNFGRMPDNHIAFPGSDVSVSRYHSSLLFEKGNFFVVDLGSKNGTYLNGKKLIPKSKTLIRPRDIIQIGSHLIQFLPINAHNENNKETGWIDQISNQLGKGFSKLETFFNPSSKPPIPKSKPFDSPSTVMKPSVPLSHSDLKDAKLKLLDKIAMGGMSVIYKAVFTDTEEIVAIKYPRSEVAVDKKILSLFKDEIRMSLKFKHPNVIHTLMAITYNNLPTMVMEYFPSKQLNYFIPTLSLQQAYMIMYQVINGLESIHSKHILHNDIKPGNMIVNESFQCKICDFGTASDISMISKMRKEWEVIGTPLYMSPEQLTPGANLNYSSDIYSLGLVMYEVFTKQHPFRTSNITETELKNKQLTMMPINPYELNKDISIPLGQLIMKTLHKDPRKRFQSIKDLKIVFEQSFD